MQHCRIKRSILVIQGYNFQDLSISFGPNRDHKITVIYGRQVPAKNAAYLRGIREYFLEDKQRYSLINGFVIEEIMRQTEKRLVQSEGEETFTEVVKNIKTSFLVFCEELITKEVYDKLERLPRPLHLGNDEPSKYLHLLEDWRQDNKF